MAKLWTMKYFHPDGESYLCVMEVKETRRAVIQEHDGEWVGPTRMAYRLRQRRGEVLAVKVRIVEGWSDV